MSFQCLMKALNSGTRPTEKIKNDKYEKSLKCLLKKREVLQEVLHLSEGPHLRSHVPGLQLSNAFCCPPVKDSLVVG